MKDLFNNEEQKPLNWEDYYIGMPEYNNIKLAEPLITATFKFRTKEDFDKFHKIVKEQLYNGTKVFDGMQKKEKKSAWYPLNEKGSRYRYE